MEWDQWCCVPLMQQSFSLEPDYWSRVRHFVILLDKICCSTLSILMLCKPDKMTGVGLGWLISLSGWSGEGRDVVVFDEGLGTAKVAVVQWVSRLIKKPHHSWFSPFTDIVKVFEDAWSNTKADCPAYYRWIGTEGSSCLQPCCMLHAQAWCSAVFSDDELLLAT